MQIEMAAYRTAEPSGLLSQRGGLIGAIDTRDVLVAAWVSSLRQMLQGRRPQVKVVDEEPSQPG